MKAYTSNSNIRRQRGMTLIELMIATVILAIIVSAGLPAMKDFFNRKNIEAIAPFFERTIKLARVEASQRGVNVRVIPSSLTKDWSQGWYMEYTDPADSTKVIVLRQFDAIQDGITFTSDKFDNTTTLTFAPTGQAVLSGAFKVFSPPCVNNTGFDLNLLLSGIIKKSLITCPN